MSRVELTAMAQRIGLDRSRATHGFDCRSGQKWRSPSSQRNPSHFTSAAQPSPAGAVPLLASIGARRGGTTGDRQLAWSDFAGASPSCPPTTWRGSAGRTPWRRSSTCENSSDCCRGYAGFSMVASRSYFVVKRTEQASPGSGFWQLSHQMSWVAT